MYWIKNKSGKVKWIFRTERLRSLGLSDYANYANFERIKEELIYFDKID